MSYEYDSASVGMMTDLLSGLNDIEDGKISATGTTYKTGGDIGAMVDIMSSLNEAGMDYGEPKSQPIYDYVDDSQYAGEYVLDENGIPVQSYTPPAPEPIMSPQRNYVDSQQYKRPLKNWGLVEEIVPGTKNTKTYSIQCNHSSQIIMNGIMMYEAALTLVNLLNEGRVLTDAKVLGIISSGIQFTNVMNETLKAAKKRQKVLNESKYDEAKELDIVIAEKKAEAFKLQERVMNFLKSEGYIK